MNKSIQEEYKIWVLVAQAYGYIVGYGYVWFCSSDHTTVQRKENRLPPILNGE